MRQDARDWAESEFRGTPGLEARLQSRLVHTAAALATRPQGTLPQRFDWAELKGAYRLIHAVVSPGQSLREVPDDLILLAHKVTGQSIQRASRNIRIRENKHYGEDCQDRRP